MPPAWEEKGKCWLGIYLPKEMRQREKLSPSGLLLTFLSWNNPQSCLPPLPTHQQAGTPPGPTPCSLPAPPQVPRWELKGELSLSWPGGCSLGPGPDLCNYVPELEAVSMFACMLSHLSRAQLFATIRTVACPTPRSVRFSRLETITGEGCHILLPPTQGWNPCLLRVLRWEAGCLPIVPPGKPRMQSERMSKLEGILGDSSPGPTSSFASEVQRGSPN